MFDNHMVQAGRCSHAWRNLSLLQSGSCCYVLLEMQSKTPQATTKCKNKVPR